MERRIEVQDRECARVTALSSAAAARVAARVDGALDSSTASTAAAEGEVALVGSQSGHMESKIRNSGNNRLDV